jgi:hypothetical protein
VVIVQPAASPVPTNTAIPPEPSLTPGPTTAIPAATATASLPPPPTATSIATAPPAAGSVADIKFTGGYPHKPTFQYGSKEPRPATWIYGGESAYTSMTAQFTVDQQPSGQAQLTLSGIDSEDVGKTPIEILLNNKEIYKGQDPLPDDTGPSDGTWGIAVLNPFPADILYPGSNILMIRNLSPTGKEGDYPYPFIMIDHAELSWGTDVHSSPPTDEPSNHIKIEDTNFTGGMDGSYGKVNPRPATWIYGSQTLSAQFTVEGQPSGMIQVSISGMDSEDEEKTPIHVRINDTEIFNGPNPLPNDIEPNHGTWGYLNLAAFPANQLHPGVNTITIENGAPSGPVGQPPFIMINYVELSW